MLYTAKPLLDSLSGWDILYLVRYPPHGEKGKPIQQICIRTGEVVKTWPSGAVAGRLLGVECVFRPPAHASRIA